MKHKEKLFPHKNFTQKIRLWSYLFVETPSVDSAVLQTVPRISDKLASDISQQSLKAPKALTVRA